MSDATLAPTSLRIDPLAAEQIEAPASLRGSSATGESRGPLLSFPELTRGLLIGVIAYTVASVLPAPARLPVGLAAVVTLSLALALLTWWRQQTKAPRLRAAVETAAEPQHTSAGLIARSAQTEGSRAAAAQAALFRSFDHLEAILDEALDEFVADDASMFTLYDSVRQLHKLGFLSPDDLQAWSRCLAIRHEILASQSITPNLPVIQQALSEMLRLQVVLTDRRRQIGGATLIRPQDEPCRRTP